MDQLRANRFTATGLPPEMPEAWRKHAGGWFAASFFPEKSTKIRDFFNPFQTWH